MGNSFSWRLWSRARHSLRTSSSPSSWMCSTTRRREWVGCTGMSRMSPYHSGPGQRGRQSLLSFEVCGGNGPAPYLQGSLTDTLTHCPLPFFCLLLWAVEVSHGRGSLMMGDGAVVGQCTRKLGALRLGAVSHGAESSWRLPSACTQRASGRF